MKDGISILKLARKTGADRATVKKWLEVEGVKPLPSKSGWSTYDEKTAMAAIKPHLRPKGSHNTEPNIDPETGLTWSQKEKREQSRKLQLENDRMEKLLSEEIMLTADHHRVIKQIVDALERLPGKVASEHGLNPAQAVGLRKSLDEAREVAAKEVGDME